MAPLPLAASAAWAIQDLDDGLVLVDLAVGGQRGQVQPWAQGQLVLNMPAFLAPELRIGDEGVDLPLTGAIEFDPVTDLPADEAVQIDVRCCAKVEIERIGRLEAQLVFEQAVDTLTAREPHGLQQIGNDATGNGKGSGHRLDLV